MSHSKAWESPRSVMTIKPEFFALPAIGRDPHFGLSRSTYYDLERRGLLRLARLRKPGNIRGRVMVPFPAVLDLLRRMGGDAAAI